MMNNDMMCTRPNVRPNGDKSASIQKEAMRTQVSLWFLYV